MDEATSGDPESRNSPLEIKGDGTEALVRSQDMDDKIPLVNGVSGKSESSASTQGPVDLAEAEESLEDQDDAPAPHGAQPSNAVPSTNESQIEVETKAKLDTLASERATLQAEVAQLRRSLEEVQERHEEDLTSVREQLAAARDEKEHAETQYHTLLGKVNTIRSQLGERLKADAVCFRKDRSRTS